MGLPKVDHDLITEIVDEQLIRWREVGSIYPRPMIEIVDDMQIGRVSARWPEPWPGDDLDLREN